MSTLSAVAVTDVLRRHVDPGAACMAVSRGPIGNGQETWFLDVEGSDGPTRLVLRRTAPAGPLEWTDRAAEANAMRAAAHAGLPVPHVHHVSEDGDELGAPYMVMDRAPGDPVVRVHGEERAALAADLARRLSQLHGAAVPDPAGRDAAAATLDEIRGWRARYEAGRTVPLPLLDALLTHLECSVPELGDAPAVLLWGDAGSHNTLGADGHVTALLDWELAHAGHPLEDLAAAVWMEQDTGVDADRLVRAYEEASGTPVDSGVLDWFVALTCVTRSVMILVGAAAVTTGRTHAPHLAGLGLHMPAHHLRRAAALLGWGSAAPPGPATTSAASAVEVLRPAAHELAGAVAGFLADEVVDLVTEPRVRRGLKTSVALLATAALRMRDEPAVTAARAAATDELLASLADDGVTGDLVDVAVAIERDPALAALRPRVRTHLLTDLDQQAALLAPLTDLYER